MSKRTWLSLALILIVATGLRFYHLDSAPPGLYPDEAMNGTNAQEANATGEYKAFYPENNGREGLFINIQALWIRVLSAIQGKDYTPEPWHLRFPSAVFGTLTVLGVFLFLKELFGHGPRGERIALLGSIFIALSFWHLVFSRIGFRAITAPLWGVWGMWLILLALRKTIELRIKNKESSKDNGSSSSLRSSLYALCSMLSPYLLPILAGFIFGLGFHSYIAYRIMPLLLLPLLVWQIKSEWVRGLKFFVLIGIGFIIVISPLALHFKNHPADFFGRTSQISVFASSTPIHDLGVNIVKTAGMFFINGDYNWRHNLPGKPALFFPIALLFVLGFLLALRAIFQKTKDKQAAWILLLWFFGSLIPVITSNEGLPHHLRAILAIPAVFGLSAWGTMVLLEYAESRSEKGRQLGAFLLGLVIAAYAVDTCVTYFNKWAINPETFGAFSANYVALGHELLSLPKETPKYVIVMAGGTNVRGLPMPTQTTMYITDTFTPEKQKAKNIFYITPEELDKIPENALIYGLK